MLAVSLSLINTFDTMKLRVRMRHIETFTSNIWRRFPSLNYGMESFGKQIDRFMVCFRVLIFQPSAAAAGVTVPAV